MAGRSHADGIGRSCVNHCWSGRGSVSIRRPDGITLRLGRLDRLSRHAIRWQSRHVGILTMIEGLIGRRPGVLRLGQVKPRKPSLPVGCIHRRMSLDCGHATHIPHARKQIGPEMVRGLGRLGKDNVGHRHPSGRAVGVLPDVRKVLARTRTPKSNTTRARLRIVRTGRQADIWREKVVCRRLGRRRRVAAGEASISPAIGGIQAHHAAGSRRITKKWEQSCSYQEKIQPVLNESWLKGCRNESVDSSRRMPFNPSWSRV